MKWLGFLLLAIGVTGLLGNWQTSWYPIPPLSITLEGQSLSIGWMITAAIILLGVLLIIKNRRQA